MSISSSFSGVKRCRMRTQLMTGVLNLVKFDYDIDIVYAVIKAVGMCQSVYGVYNSFF